MKSSGSGKTEYQHAFPNKMTKFLNESVEHRPFLVLCNHCENPPCCRVCPTKATFKRESDGIVLMDFHRCIGCRFCMVGVPTVPEALTSGIRVPVSPKQNDQFPTRMKGVVEKCNFCAERLAVGEVAVLC